MRRVALKKIKLSDPRANFFQDNLQENLDRLNAPFLSGRVLEIDGDELLDITTAGLSIAHKLARTFSGFIVFYKSTNCNIWENAALSYDREKFIRLESNATSKIKVWVF